MAHKRFWASTLAHTSDIARTVGVSNATMSRVINGTAKVSKEKIKWVEETIRKTGFNPNEVTHSLYKESSRLIGYIVPSTLDIFLNEVGRTIEDEAFHGGYKMIFCNLDENSEKEASYIKMLMDMNADDIIITTSNEHLEEEIRSYLIPTVLMNKSTGAFYAALVQSDNYTGARIAAEHLIDCRCRKPVLMCEPIQYPSNQQCHQGYMDVCREYRIGPLFVNSRYNYDEGAQSTRELFERYPDTDGILTSTGLVTFALYEVLYERHHRAPDGVMVMGYDNMGLSRLMIPTLTAAAQSAEKIGRLCIQLIVEQTGHGTVQQRENMPPVSLKIQETTRRKEGV